MRNFLKLSLLLLFISVEGFSQQDPQFTQYMYNTMSVNPAYAGSRGHTTITALGRTQWVGFDGAPDTQTLSYDTPLGYSGVGLGINLVNDKLGPSHETYLDANISYTIRTGNEGNLALGLKIGGRLLNVDWSRGTFQSPEPRFNTNINNKFLPTLGAGVYYHKPKWYVGLAVPNFIRTDHYDDNIESVAVERLHFFLITGYVFDLNESIKFKPAALLKGVQGAPLSLDISANFLFNEKFRAGLAWRWDDSISALLGFQVSDGLNIGYAYDLTTSNYSNYNSGTHEVMLRYEIFREGPVKSPRFF
ncbi:MULTISPECIES: PorP/SprF family type IX secretion system membrane protein [Tenacibaculum]|uniref:PorP/SprF family type IX secretion system membrane protein n=1 Tax=Tenacibaculum TaxID=104267 RepID=UPI001F0A1618|nr:MULTISPECIES: type IX secretion system membrane protein PorP/SprF [Tenacibaculum]MCH3882894.1 type IX secretion system membrane protein PorP/SprF [Tenacibaculum aquimarinum]MDO6600845.1 type IX secretion system membrane protein PorP/SprF [Tenacibaculum sp. 1_MG-2023]